MAGQPKSRSLLLNKVAITCGSGPQIVFNMGNLQKGRNIGPYPLPHCDQAMQQRHAVASPRDRHQDRLSPVPTRWQSRDDGIQKINR